MTKRPDWDQAWQSLGDGQGAFERKLAANDLLVPPDVQLDQSEKYIIWSLQKPEDQARRAARLEIWPGPYPADAIVNFEPYGQTKTSPWRASEMRRVAPGRGMLDDFLELCDAEPHKVRNYARRWGILGLCRHNRPYTHRPWYVVGRKGGCIPRDWNGQGGREPVAVWRRYARMAKMILNAAAGFHERESGPHVSSVSALLAKHPAYRSEDKFGLHSPGVSALLAEGPYITSKEIGDRTGCWTALGRILNEWLMEGDVRPMLIAPTEKGNPTVALGSFWTPLSLSANTLFGALGIQMLFLVAGERGIAWCSLCKHLFQPKRKLAPGSRHYCPDCGRKGMQRHASQVYRDRQKSKQGGLKGGAKT